MSEPPLLQICPNDRAPFLDICEVYRVAAAAIGRELITVFLSAAHATAMPAAVYLNCSTLRRTGPVAHALHNELAALLGSGTAPRVSLAICHRYRAYRTFRAGRFELGRCLVIAHEFGFFERWRRRLDQRVFAGQVRFAGVSEPVVDELARAVKQPLLMPNGIDAAKAQAQRIQKPRALAALKLRDECFNIGVVGRLHPKKQPQLAIDGFAAIVEQLPDAHLVFIGDGELEGSLRERAQGLSVSFAGFVPEAARYLAALDVLLIPSGEHEAFSMVALEAMAAGIAVVAGPAPGPRFVLGDVGHYFGEFSAEHLAAAVTAVYLDRGRDTARLDRGIERTEKQFSVGAVAQRLEALL